MTRKDGDAQLRSISRLAPSGYEAEAALHTIVLGEADALVVETTSGPRVYTLEGANEPYRRLVENISEAALILDCSGAIIYCNGRLPSLLNLDGVVGRDLRQLTADDARGLAEALLAQGATAKASAELALLTKDHSRVAVRVVASPMTFNEQTCIALVVSALDDIEALRISEARLKEADRRKDEFLATLAHELRNPLAPIHNGVHILKAQQDAGVAAKSVLDMMQRQIEQMVRLVDELLEVSRISSGKIDLRQEPVCIDLVMRDALEACQPAIDEMSHRVIVSRAEQALWVHGDHVRLVQVMINLINNAVKYTPPGGRVELGVTRAGEEAVLRVCDNGVGLPDDMLTRVFDLFTQIDGSARGSKGGLGVGLALARQLVELHGGRIAATSPGVGRGSEFSVRLPLCPAPAAKAPDTAAAPGCYLLRAVVIDDDPDVGDSFGMLLESFGVDVRVVYDGLSGLAALDAFRPDLVFLDIGMPGMDGYETARRMRETAPQRNFRLVALTGWGQDEDRRRTEAAGFDLHVTKPASIDVVEALLRQAQAL